MSDQECKCKKCGRPLPVGVGPRCEACKADRNAMIGKVIQGIGAGVVIVLGFFFNNRRKS